MNMSLSITNQQLLIDDVKLAYYITDHSDKPTIVLLHGYCGSSAYFHKLVPLLEKVANVIVFDLFGHGQSEPLKQEKYSLEHVATMIHKALQLLNVKQAYMFGHSLGGYITLAYAKQFAQHLLGFGLLHSTALPDSDVAKTNRLNVIASVKVEGVEQFANQLATKLFGNEVSEQDLQLAQAIGVQTSPAGVIGFAHAMRERENAQEVINTSQVPVLLIAGAQDKIVSPEGVFTGHNEQTVCEIIDDAGHMGMLETENEMASIIERFICN